MMGLAFAKLMAVFVVFWNGLDEKGHTLGSYFKMRWKRAFPPLEQRKEFMKISMSHDPSVKNSVSVLDQFKGDYNE